MARRLCVASVLLILIAVVACDRQNDDQARAQLLQFRNSLQPGATKDAVETSLRSAEYADLKLIKQSPEVWIIATPYVFGASNWWLYLTFSNSTVAEIKVRTEDSAEHRPRDAPPDIVRK
jgi:hypothetical protein